jgi:large repetitive protein
MNTATVLADLTWNVAINLTDGTYVFTATEIDTLLQPSPPSLPVTVTIDTVPPGAPTLLTPASGATTPALGATFTGQGTQVGNIVWLFISGLRTISAVVDVSLNWTIIGNISPPGTYLFEVSEQDASGNEGPRSPGVTVTAT